MLLFSCQILELQRFFFFSILMSQSVANAQISVLKVKTNPFTESNVDAGIGVQDWPAGLGALARL